jgi:hypothetical protein
MRRAWIVALALLALLLSGCGGGSSGPLTKSELIEKGDEICRKADATQSESLDAYIKEHPGSSAFEEGSGLLLKSVGLPPLAAELEELRELKPSESAATQYAAFIKSFQAAFAAIEAKPQLMASSAHNPLDEPDRLAREYGFTDCAELG